MIEFAIDALACHRVTRLIVEDSIFDRPREALKARLHRGGHMKALELLRCSWCVSVWVGFGVVTVRAAVPRAWGPAARALALSSVAGTVSAMVAG